MNKIEAIAHRMTESAMGYARPYTYLKNAAEDSVYRHLGTPSDLIQAQIAAVNILKNRGVEHPKRKPLSSLNQKQRQQMRAIAKDLAAKLQKMLPRSCVFVSTRPISDDRITIGIKSEKHTVFTTFLYPEYQELLRWNALPVDQQMLCLARLSENYKTRDEKIAAEKEVIAANLEDLFNRSTAERPQPTPEPERPRESRVINKQLSLEF